jgi:hypothetical protein
MSGRVHIREQSDNFLYSRPSAGQESNKDGEITLLMEIV